MNVVDVLEFAAMSGRALLLQQFGARLKALREEKGWTPAETMARVGCSRGYYYKLERGEKEFSVEMLSRLARAFRLDPMDFFCVPDASVRHGVYDLLRRAPETVLLRTKLHLIEELQALPHPLQDAGAAPSLPKEEAHATRRRKRASR